MLTTAPPDSAPTTSEVAPATMQWPKTAPAFHRTRAAPPQDTWRHFMRDLLRGAVVLLVLNLFVVQISVVRGHSMEPSIQNGDRLVVDRLAPHVHCIARFDVVVLRYPCDPRIDVVKRIVGLPGDRIRMDGDRLLVNGEAVTETFAHVADSMGMDERIVPPGHYFVLGDNRPISCDSREFGVVPSDYVRGKVRACFWPFARLSLL